MYQIDSKQKNRNAFVKYEMELDFRITAYFREYLMLISELYKELLSENLGKIKDEETTIIKDNLIKGYVDYKKVPKLQRSTKKKIEKKIEEHYGGVFADSVKVPAGAIDINTHLMKFYPKKKGELSDVNFILTRFSPWHFDTLPFLPDEKEIKTVFLKVSIQQAEKGKNKNISLKTQYENIMRKSGIKMMSREEILEGLNGYNDLQHWSIKKEKGIDGDKQEAWRPALKKLLGNGYSQIIKSDKILNKILYDMSYSKFKSIDKGYDIIDQNVAEELTKFEEIIRG